MDIPLELNIHTHVWSLHKCFTKFSQICVLQSSWNRGTPKWTSKMVQSWRIWKFKTREISNLNDMCVLWFAYFTNWFWFWFLFVRVANLNFNGRLWHQLTAFTFLWRSIVVFDFVEWQCQLLGNYLVAVITPINICWRLIRRCYGKVVFIGWFECGD